MSLNLSWMSLTAFLRVVLAGPMIFFCSMSWASCGLSTYSCSCSSSMSLSISFTCLVTLSLTVVLNYSSKFCCFCRT